MTIERSQPEESATEKISIIPLDFEHQGKIPRQFHYENQNEIPRFQIKNVPDNAKSLAIIMEDTDTPGKNHVHWIVYNIDPGADEIGGEKISGDTGKNTWTMKEYQGANPIQGKHLYRFTIYALDEKIDMNTSYKSDELRNRIIGSSISYGYVEAYCERKGSFALE